MAILVLTSVLAAPIAYAKKGQVTVRVTNTNEKGTTRKVVGTEVILKLDDVSELIDTTDEKGKAVFTGLEPNSEYTIYVTGTDGVVYHKTFTTNKNGGAPQQNIDVG